MFSGWTGKDERINGMNENETIYQIYNQGEVVSIRRGHFTYKTHYLGPKESYTCKCFIEDGGKYEKSIYDENEKSRRGNDRGYIRYANEDGLIDALDDFISQKLNSISIHKKSISSLETSIKALTEIRDQLKQGDDIKTIVMGKSLDDDRLKWAKRKRKEGYSIGEIAKALHIPTSFMSDALQDIKPEKKKPLKYEEEQG